MTDQKSAAAVVRLESCKANLDSEYPTCERCGLAWDRAKPAPACDPMTLERLRLVLLSESAALEGSHHAVVSMRDAGMPSDPVSPLKRATELRAALRFIDNCLDNPATIIAHLQRRIADQRGREDEMKRSRADG